MMAATKVTIEWDGVSICVTGEESANHPQEIGDAIAEAIIHAVRFSSWRPKVLAHAILAVEDYESAEKGALPADLVSAAERILQQEPKGGE